jgi:hypothetical protein
MTIENVEVSVTLPRVLWEQLLQWAQSEQENETTLLTRAIEQFLRQEADKLALAERLERECEELAKMEFDDVGTEDEWLVIQNEALNDAEVNFG